MRLFIAVLDEVPDFIVPTLVAHSVLGAHLVHLGNEVYDTWLRQSFRKIVLRVNRKEFAKIRQLGVYEGYENTTLKGEITCLVPLPYTKEQTPNVLKFAKLWKPIGY